MFKYSIVYIDIYLGASQIKSAQNRYNGSDFTDVFGRDKKFCEIS